MGDEEERPVLGLVEEKTVAVSNGSESTDEPSGLEAKIIRQVEYYFGDCNLVSDKFMRQQVNLNDGWIPMELMIRFNRLKSLTTDYDVIVKALRKSSNQLIEISEDGQKLRRNPEKPLPEKTPNHMEDLREKSVYLKGFPLGSTLDQLMDFFKGKGNVQKIYMRKKLNSKNFKGSIFITFGSKEEAEEFMKIESVKYKNKELSKELSVDYHARKQVEFQKRKEEQDRKKEAREKRKHELEEEVVNDEVKAEEDKEGDNKEEKEGMDTSSKIEIKGCVLKLTGVEEKTTWEDIRNVFNKHAQVSFVDYTVGEEEALVRFREEDDAKKVIDAAQTEGSDPKTVSICGKEVVIQVIEGDEEEEYWKKFKKVREQLSKKRKEREGYRPNYRARGGRGGRGFRGGFNKRPHDRDGRDGPEPPRKVARAD